VALGGRAVGEGVVGALGSLAENTPFNMITRILTGRTPQQLGIGATNAMLGTHLSAPGSYGEVLSNFLTRFGAPSPQTPGEQLVSAGLRGASGALALGGVAGGLSVPNAIRTGISGTTGAVSSEFARQQGAGLGGQLVAGLAGGMAPAAAEGIGRLGARAVTDIVAPYTQSGRENIAGGILQRQASDPQAAAANLRAAQDIVPGSARTTGEASQDLGLLALEKGLRSRSTADFGQRLSEQNAARQAQLQGLAGTDADVLAAQTARDAQTGVMRETALGSGGQADISPVLQHIDDTLAGPIGKRDVPSQALTWLRGKLHDEAGNPETDPANLYAVRQDVNDAIAGKLGGEQSKFRLAQGQLIQARSALDDSIESAAPGFKAYLQRYSELSRPIDQRLAIQEIERRANLPTVDIKTGQPFLGSSAFTRALDAAQQDTALSPQQSQSLRAIQTDLQLGQAINSPLVRAPGSDTYQNLSIAQVIGGGGFLHAHGPLALLTKPLSWLFKLGPETRTTETLTQAMLDPKFAADLLQRATPARVNAFSERLRAATLGTAGGLNPFTPSTGIPNQSLPSAPIPLDTGLPGLYSPSSP